MIGLAVLSAAVVLLLCRAADLYQPQLPTSGISYAMQDWQSKDTEEDNCCSFVYEGRRYLYYSQLSRRLTKQDVRSCLGCTSYDGTEHKEELILSLCDDPDHNYLVLYYDGPALMKAPSAVYRAEDTRFQKIETPKLVVDPIEGNPMYRHWMAVPA